jgi:hypothetical protein
MVLIYFKKNILTINIDKINTNCNRLSQIYNRDTNKIIIPPDLDWVLNDYSVLKNYLIDGEIPKLMLNSNNNFHLIIDLLNLYNFLKYYEENLKVNEIQTILDNYFKNKNYNDNQNPFNLQIQKMIKNLYELQTLWMFPNYWKQKWDEYFESLMKKIIIISEPRNYISKMSYTSIFINILTNTSDNISIKKKISNEILFYMLEECIKTYPSRNIFNISDLKILNIEFASLNNFIELKREFNYWNTTQNITFDMEIIQKRMTKYSQGLINNNFPFDYNKYIIAGGFALNAVIGVISDFTDIDIYIFDDFENSVNILVKYFMGITNIKLTNNKSLINIYPIGYKINIQLIKIEHKPVAIINDFDLSYSQICIFDWHNILMTYQAYQTLITGYFKINKTVIIKPYRIIKGYIKGFKLDKSEFLEINNNININLKNNRFKRTKMLNLYKYNKNNDNNLAIEFSDEVKSLILKINSSSMNELEQNLIDYLQKNKNQYNSLKKGIYLTEEHINNFTEENIISYLENLSGCIYFNFENFNPDNFVNLQYYNIDYDNENDEDNNKDELEKINNVKCNDIDKYTFPLMQDITFSKQFGTDTLKYDKINENTIFYELSVITGSYYQNLRALKFYPFKFLININDIKIFKLSIKDKIFKFKISYKKINEKVQHIINSFDFNLQVLARSLLNRLCKLPDNINCKKTNNLNKTILFNTNIDKFMSEYIDNDNFTFNDLKDFNNDCDKYSHIYELPKCLLKKDDMIELKIFINGLWHQEKKNDHIFGYELESIINLCD